MRRRLSIMAVLAFLSALAAAPAYGLDGGAAALDDAGAASSPAMPSATGTITGTVVDAATGDPLASAADGAPMPADVFLLLADPPGGSLPERIADITETDGSFELSAAPGDYLLLVTSPLPGAPWEYIPRTYDNGGVAEAAAIPVSVSDGGTLDLTVEMHRAALLRIGPILTDSAADGWEWYGVARYVAPGVSEGNASDGVVSPGPLPPGPLPTIDVSITTVGAYLPGATVWGCATGGPPGGPAAELCSTTRLTVTPGAVLSTGALDFLTPPPCVDGPCASPDPAAPPQPPATLPESGAVTLPLLGAGLGMLTVGLLLRLTARPRRD